MSGTQEAVDVDRRKEMSEPYTRRGLMEYLHKVALLFLDEGVLHTPAPYNSH